MDLIWGHNKNILLLFRKEIYLNLNRSEFLLNLSNPSKYKKILSQKTETDLENEIKSFRKKLREKGIFDKKYFMMDRWHDTDDPEFLVNSINAFLEETKDIKKQFIISQVILTNQRNIWNHVKRFYKKGLISIEKLCELLHQDEIVSNYLIEGLFENKFNIGI
jgi:hypothetical protein